MIDEEAGLLYVVWTASSYFPHGGIGQCHSRSPALSALLQKRHMTPKLRLLTLSALTVLALFAAFLVGRM